MSWVAVGSGVVSLIGGVAGGLGEAKKRKGIRRLGRMNAERLEKQAQAVERQTAEDVVGLRQILAKVVGEQRAGWGASGLSGDSGSALDVLSASVTAGLDDQRRRKEAGAVAAEDLRYAAKIGDLQAGAALQESSAAGMLGIIRGVGQAATYGAEGYQKLKAN